MSYMNIQNSSCHLSISYHLKHCEEFFTCITLILTLKMITESKQDSFHFIYKKPESQVGELTCLRCSQ